MESLKSTLASCIQSWAFGCVQLMVSRNQISREVLSSPELKQITGPLNPYDTTEVHCNEFFPNSTTSTLTSVYAASAQLATVLLESWSILLGKPPSKLAQPSAEFCVLSQLISTIPGFVPCPPFLVGLAEG